MAAAASTARTMPACDTSNDVSGNPSGAIVSSASETSSASLARPLSPTSSTPHCHSSREEPSSVKRKTFWR